MLASFIMLLSNTSEDIHNSYSRVTSAMRSLAVAMARPWYPEPDPVNQKVQRPFDGGLELEVLKGTKGSVSIAGIFFRFIHDAVPFTYCISVVLGNEALVSTAILLDNATQLSSGS